jgi:hypothetical protein
MATPTTLPATFVSGDILTAAQMNNLRGAFRVLQIVTANTTTAASSSTTTYVDSNLTATITPQSTASTILVMVTQSMQKSAGNATNYAGMKLLRGASVIFTPTVTDLFTGTAMILTGTSSFYYLDSPATTSATTYKTQIASPNNTASITAQPSSAGYSTIVLMEISA